MCCAEDEAQTVLTSVYVRGVIDKMPGTGLLLQYILPKGGAATVLTSSQESCIFVGAVASFTTSLRVQANFDPDSGRLNLVSRL